jgi:hypothetical protein
MVSRKIIKKFVQITAILLLIILAVPATAFLLLQNSKIQNQVTDKIMLSVSDKLGTRFSISSIDISFLYRVRLNDVYLEDLHGDTLIFVKRLTTGIKYINPASKSVSIGSINLDKAIVALAIDSTSELNLNFIIEKLKGDGNKKKAGWVVQFNNIRLQDTRFSLKNFDNNPVAYGINFSDLQTRHIDAELRRFKPSKDSLSFHLKSMRLEEKSGFIIREMSCDFSQHRTFLSFRNISLETNNSFIHGKDISLRFKDYNDFKGKAFTGNVRLRLDLEETELDFSDIGYFAPVFRDANQKIQITGLIKGPVNNIDAEDLDLHFGTRSRIWGNLQFEGLPEISQTFILANIKQLSSNYADILSIGRMFPKSFRLPEVLKKLGETTYAGNFTGFINDFVAYGSFNTQLGVVKTDILFKPDSSSILDFQGKLNIIDFKLGELLDASENVGSISLTASIDGATIEGKSINATMNGIVQKFELMRYNYSNISLSGNLNNKTFNGSVNVRDPNIDLEFLGKVDFSDTIPVFDFTANVTDADFYALNISRSNPDLRASFYMIANARGTSINNLNGEVKLLNSLFIKNEKQLQIYDLSIISESTRGHSLLKLRSDFMDADLSGNFELTRSGETFKQFLYKYMPAMVDSAGTSNTNLYHSIKLKSTIKNIKPIFDFFAPEYNIAENSTLNMNFEPNGQMLHAHLQSPSIVSKGIVWHKVNIIVDGNQDLLDLQAGSENLILANRIKLENFTALSSISGDTAGIRLRWNNWDELQYRGNINARAEVTRKSPEKSPHIQIHILPSTFVTNDTLWSLQPGIISLDSSSIQFDNVNINHKKEYVRINGTLSESADDILNVVFNRFNIANLNGITGPSGYHLGGILNGDATLSNLYSRPLFTSVLKIDSLLINNQMLGNMNINSSWNDRKKAIELDAYALRNNLKTINIKGEYAPSDKGRLAFELELEKFWLNILNPYVKTIFTDLRGIASGKANLKGTLEKPVLNGRFDLQKTSFTVNYLQTRYSFSDQIEIENNNISFDNIKIFDSKGNTAFLNGAIRNRYLKDFYLDLTINTRDFMSLNTTFADNKQFYGTAFSTSVVKIAGPPKNLFMDITATTNKNTSIKIPLSNFGELNEYPFINVTFPESEDDFEEEETEYQVNASGIQIRFRLTVTPDADVQIIIDQQLGEIIKGRGSGNLDMRINSSGDFRITGDYVIDQGEYLFTLQKVINKKLTIEPGGSLRWDGDPLDASINITANYPVRASLSDLLGSMDDQKLLVYDRVIMSGKLMSPDIKYDIYLPNADETTRMKVRGAIPTAEEQSRQFISLLMNNRFYLNPERAYSTTNTSSSYSSAAGVNFSEMLSNQLSNWLSQLVNDLDIDVNYRSNKQLNSDEVQMVVTYPLFNDRLIINGSLEATNATKAASDELVGEFDVDYKLTKNGKVTIKTYNHSNNEYLYEDQSAYTQGLGVTYKEEFNTFGELMRRLFGKKEESPEPETAEESDNSVNN